MHLEVLLHLFVGNPDGGQASGLGGHDIDTVTEVDGQAGNAGAGELQYLVLHKTALEHGLHEGDGHVVRANTTLGLTLQPYQHYLGGIDVPGVFEELLHQLTTTFADTHVTQGAVTRVGVRAQDHVAAGSEGLTGILVNNGLVGRHIDTAIFLGSAEAKHVVVLIDSTAHCAKRIVTVSHSIRQRELLQSAGAGRLDNTHIRDVMRHHGVEADV